MNGEMTKDWWENHLAHCGWKEGTIGLHAARIALCEEKECGFTLCKELFNHFPKEKLQVKKNDAPGESDALVTVNA